ncbi:MAG: PHP domain-containing protein [Firmicutes bacterium]|nr:PHP domain-containing protein [Bacillota bacterium]
MVDLHTHTNHSDGRLSVRELLELANDSGISVLSITDHNSVDAYKEVGDIFKGKLVTGVELNTYVGKQYVEILGYGFDVGKMENEIEKFTFKNVIWKSKAIAEKVFSKNGLDLKLEPEDICPNGFVHCQILIDKHGDKIKNLYPDLELINGVHLFRTEIVNPKSKWFNDLSAVYPSFSEAADIIRRCGGLVFLAHPYCYAEIDKVLAYTKNQLDGIECFHYSSTQEQSEYLLEFCKQNNLLVSRGSDFHKIGERHLGYLCTPEVPTWV